MGRRYVAFLVALFGSGFMLFGAMYGQGMAGSGMFFGAAGVDTASMGAFVGIAAAWVSLIATILLMFVRDVRPLAIIILLAGVVGVLAAGTLFAAGALLTFVGAGIALTVRRDAAVV